MREGIRELSAGDLEMRGDEQAIETYLSTAFAWSAGDTERRMPGGENGAEALRRFDISDVPMSMTAGAAVSV